MPDLLVRDIEDDLKRLIEDRDAEFGCLLELAARIFSSNHEVGFFRHAA